MRDRPFCICEAERSCRSTGTFARNAETYAIPRPTMSCQLFPVLTTSGFENTRVLTHLSSTQNTERANPVSNSGHFPCLDYFYAHFLAIVLVRGQVTFRWLSSVTVFEYT